ncbi:MAG: G-D-S-L family lipolytic protein, partial [Salibacteraceae bacterium]
MKKNLAIILVSTLAIVSCKPEFDEVTISGGTADFSNYVAIGNSLTAGYADNALYTSGQENSYPMILSTQMGLSTGNTFNQP